MSTESIEKVESVNMDQKITVRSIAGWPTGFKRIETTGDVTIQKQGNIRLTRREVIAQVQSGNKLFTGTDDRGSHATLYIDDEPTRLEVEFDSKEEKRVQQVLNDEVVQKLFSYKTLKTFEERMKEAIVTRAEKYAIVQMISKLKLNDHEKIRIVEQYTGFKI